MSSQFLRIRIIGATLVAGISGFAYAQTMPLTLPQPGDSTQAGTLLHFGVKSSLRHDSNLNLARPSPGASTLFDTGLSFGLTSVTRRSSALLGLSGVLRAANTPAGVNVSSFDAQKVTLGFKHIGPTSSLTLGGGYDKTSLQFLDPLSQTLVNGADLVPTTGTRQQFNAQATYEMGKGGPYGLTLTARTYGRRYSGTGAGYYDSTSSDAALTGRAELNTDNTLQLRLGAGTYAAHDANATHQQHQSLALSWGHALGADSQIRLTLGAVHQRLETAASHTSSTQPLLGARYARQSGGVTDVASWDHRLTPSGTRDTLRFRRTSGLPTGRLTYMLGATRREGGSTQAIGALGYDVKGRRSVLSANLSRRVISAWNQTGLDTQDEMLTRADISYRVKVNALTGVSVGFGYARVDPIGGGAYRSWGSVTAAYDRYLTRDWQLSLGLTHRNRDDAISGAASGNAVFVTLGRSFTIRP